MEASRGIWWDSASKNEFENRVAFRIDRQRNTFDPAAPKKVHLIFTEDAFTSEVGSPEVMQAQYGYMCQAIERYRGILTVQVVPSAARNNPAQHGGLTVFDFGDLLRPIGFLPVVYGPSTYLNKVEDTDRLLRAFRVLQKIAYSPEASERMIREKMGA